MSVAMNVTKRRIKSIQSTAKITRAMGLVAVTRLKTWQRKFMVNRSFANQLSDIMFEAVRGVDRSKSNFLRLHTEANSVLHVVITSSLGLAGPYNNNILLSTMDKIGPSDEVVMIGKRGQRAFKKANIATYDEFLDLNISYDEIRKLGSYLFHQFESGKYERVVIHYTNYINSMTSEVKHVTLLPFGIEESYLSPIELDKRDQELLSNIDEDTDDSSSEFLESLSAEIETLIEPNKELFFEQFVPIYLNNMLYAYILAAQVAEQSARRMAMDLATDNANEMIDDLMIKYNAARQAAITQEITEIVSGAI